jgi:aldehyde:ferredoxin oxidoreductase
MRKYLHIDLENQSIDSKELNGEALARAGRYLIVKTLLEAGVATIDPLSADNQLIFSAGPFAGTSFSNANRISVGCKSPLTGGIKESNGGGTFAFALGQLELAGLTLLGASSDWVVIRITKEGEVTFDDAEPYLRKGLFEAAALLHEKYGDKVSIGICGPVAEYGGLIAGIAFSDQENRPVRLSARGGVGAVMGSKKVKAIVVDKHKMPTFHDRKKLMTSVREYGVKLDDDAAIKSLGRNGTAQVADIINHLGGLPVRNFGNGQVVDRDKETLKMGGDYIREQNIARGGNTTHACMPGCMIKCSNVYNDADGNEVVSPLEYETIGLLGTNCGLTDPDDVARLNWTANDLGIDTIETGALLGILMDSGQAEYGDITFMEKALEDIRQGNERGRLLAQGTARVGEHFGIERVPVIKKQAISAYDPRVIEVTGISMMVTAQGADHTTGNLFNIETKDKDTKELTAASMEVQMMCAAADSLGLCVFGRSVTNINLELITTALNDALGTDLDVEFFARLGLETLELEIQFNEQAGFTEPDDELPAFFYDNPLPPTDKTARHHSAEVNRFRKEWMAAQATSHRAFR